MCMALLHMYRVLLWIHESTVWIYISRQQMKGKAQRKALQRTAAHHHTLQHTATRCNILQHTLYKNVAAKAGATRKRIREREYEKENKRRSERHCNTLQRTAIHCNTLHPTASHCNTLQHTATHYNTHCTRTSPRRRVRRSKWKAQRKSFKQSSNNPASIFS